MKRIITALLLTAIFAVMLVGCGLTVPAPQIKEGEFNVTVTYEVDGETKTLDLVYVCEYGGSEMSMEGTRNRVWNGHFDGYEDGEVIEVATTKDGGKIALSFLIYPEFFMGEPDYAKDFYPHIITNHIYYEDGIEMIDDDQELIAKDHGVKVISCEYDAPIENSFG